MIAGGYKFSIERFRIFNPVNEVDGCHDNQKEFTFVLAGTNASSKEMYYHRIIVVDGTEETVTRAIKRSNFAIKTVIFENE
jgi:hypothetical protein